MKVGRGGRGERGRGIILSSRKHLFRQGKSVKEQSKGEVGATSDD